MKPSPKTSESLKPKSLPPITLGEYLPIGAHTKVDLVVQKANLAEFKKLSEILPRMPIAIPSQTPVRLSLLPGAKLIIDFLGNDVEFHPVQGSQEDRILRVQAHPEGMTLHIALGKDEYSVELKKSGAPHIIGDNEQSHTVQRTSYPFRSSEADSERNSESRGGCGGGER